MTPARSLAEAITLRHVYSRIVVQISAIAEDLISLRPYLGASLVKMNYNETLGRVAGPPCSRRSDNKTWPLGSGDRCLDDADLTA